MQPISGSIKRKEKLQLQIADLCTEPGISITESLGAIRAAKNKARAETSPGPHCCKI
jgi:hypothetical protein